MLRERGFTKLLLDIKQVNNVGRDCHIVLIGGSHSAFSIAWLLINGPLKPR